MIFTILTLFPDLIESYFSSSIMARAVNTGNIFYTVVNIRDFATDRHKTCDDSPYGGGPGMVLKPEPLARAIDSLEEKKGKVIYPNPGGIPFSQHIAEELSNEERLTFICGKYEGIDQRIIDIYVDKEITIGDYVLSSGEIACLVIIDTISRLKEGFINRASLAEESFSSGLLEYPHYTRPELFRGLSVPEILLSGHHERIRAWRLRKSLEKTEKNRQDLLQTNELNEEEKRILAEIRRGEGNGHNQSN